MGRVVSVTDVAGKVHKVSGPAAELILWLLQGGTALFAIPHLRGELAFDFSNDEPHIRPRVTAIAGTSPPASTN